MEFFNRVSAVPYALLHQELAYREGVSPPNCVLIGKSCHPSVGPSFDYTFPGVRLGVEQKTQGAWVEMCKC